MSKYIKDLVKKARQSSYKLQKLSSQQKNDVLQAMAQALLDNSSMILQENKKDVARAQKNKVKRSFIDRLTLTRDRLQQMSTSLHQIAALADPVGRVIDGWPRPNGIMIEKVRVPIGVVLIIYEARPNVTSDCAGLLFKSSNIAILRGGGDAFYSNQAIGKVLLKAAKSCGIDFAPFFIIEDTSHAVVDELLSCNEEIDMVIPRGGEALISKVVSLSKIPVIKHYKGVCHIFVDENVDMQQALDICVNAKVQRPSVCNAVETILVHKKCAQKFLPRLQKALSSANVELRGDEATCKILRGIKRATEKDWTTEYTDLILSLKVVDDLAAAIEHINTYGSHHTDSILTKDMQHAQEFVNAVDSACCFVNISTRFSDGYEFGLGAEIGISTDKLHARGPMGLEELTTYKYIARGNGQTRI